MATEHALVDQGSNAFLECQVDANPLSDDVIRWQRPNFDMSRTRSSIENGRSYLIINNVTREDSGVFLCVADNGIGNEAQKTSTLVVKREYPSLFGDSWEVKGSDIWVFVYWMCLKF